MVSFSFLWGRKKPAPGKKPAAKPTVAGSTVKGSVKDSPRARLINDALALHQRHGASLRAVLQNALKALEDRKTLRKPEELERLLQLVQAQRAMQRLFSGDLRRYLVLAGLRQWTGKEPAGVDKDGGASRPRIVRR